ncbi:hypothetical protein BDZ97DRAFT_717207 [Flammula alnicola]|nr:hypothetical protein BDZ97DRAFT_717207 [Flammula alnicola]
MTSEKKKPSGISLLRPSNASSPASSSRSSSLSSTRSGGRREALYHQRPLLPFCSSDRYYTNGYASGHTSTTSQWTSTVCAGVNNAQPRALAKPDFSRASIRPLDAFSTPPRADGRAHASAINPTATPFTPESREISPAPVLHRKIGILNGHGHPGHHLHGLTPGDEEEGWGPRTFFDNTVKSMKLQVGRPRLNVNTAELKARVKKEVSRAPEHARTAVKAVPAVLLGCLLNILDGVSSYPTAILTPSFRIFLSLRLLFRS